ncbi:MAG: hypothetical protein PVH17_05460 [Anaerolineae bacterium]|jgi:hypothetical protein
MNSPRRNDRDLTVRHVQALSSADQLADFFAHLHYPTDARISMTPESLQLNTALTNATRRIERLTSVNGMLQVYLFELTSVTVAHRRALTRVFRNRIGNFLLVLTDDYEQSAGPASHSWTAIWRTPPSTGSDSSSPCASSAGTITG